MEQPARQRSKAGGEGLPEKLLDDRLCRPGNLAPSGEAGFMGAEE